MKRSVRLSATDVWILGWAMQMRRVIGGVLTFHKAKIANGIIRLTVRFAR